jgi:hypothetical protein
MDNEDPEVNQWVCIGMLVITIAIMGATAEWVSTISPAPFSYRHPLLVG